MEPFFTPPALSGSGATWRALDHAALYHALTQCQQVHCVLFLDTDILAPVLPCADRRVEFIRESLVELMPSA